MEKIPEPIALEFAGFWRRLGAMWIDLIALSVISSQFISFNWSGFPGFGSSGGFFVDPAWTGPTLFPFGNPTPLLIGIAYFIGFWVWRGQTPGKMVLRIKIVRTDGTNITLSAALLRYLGYMVSAAIFFIGFIWIAFDRHKQGLHDKMADTYVVKLPEPIPAAPEQAASA